MEDRVRVLEGKFEGGVLGETGPLRWVPRVIFELLKWKASESGSGLLMHSSTDPALLIPPALFKTMGLF